MVEDEKQVWLWAIKIDGIWTVAYKQHDDGLPEAWWQANHDTWCGVVGKEDKAIKLHALKTLSDVKGDR